MLCSACAAPRGTTLHLGNALAARLYASLLARQVEMLFSADVEDLVVEGGRISGVTIRHGSRDRTIAARRGVVLATGGFSHDAPLRKRFFPPAAGFVSATSISGNDMGSIMNGNYPGPGITLGPALTFGYIAGRHMAENVAARREAERA
jgi:succinate dehydrogenase/fumarate reductase flavoprotein subunit